MTLPELARAFTDTKVMVYATNKDYRGNMNGVGSVIKMVNEKKVLVQWYFENRAPVCVPIHKAMKMAKQFVEVTSFLQVNGGSTWNEGITVPEAQLYVDKTTAQRMSELASFFQQDVRGQVGGLLVKQHVFDVVYAAVSRERENLVTDNHWMPPAGGIRLFKLLLLYLLTTVNKAHPRGRLWCLSVGCGSNQEWSAIACAMREAGVTPEQFHVDCHESNKLAVDHSNLRRTAHQLQEYVCVSCNDCSTQEWADEAARHGPYNFAMSTNTEEGRANNRMLEVLTRSSDRDVLVAGLLGFQFTAMSTTHIVAPWGTIVFVYMNAKRNRNKQKWTMDQPRHHLSFAQENQDEFFRGRKRARKETDFFAYGKKSEQLAQYSR